jgi:hypothetical protein
MRHHVTLNLFQGPSTSLLMVSRMDAENAFSMTPLME